MYNNFIINALLRFFYFLIFILFFATNSFSQEPEPCTLYVFQCVEVLPFEWCGHTINNEGTYQCNAETYTDEDCECWITEWEVTICAVMPVDLLYFNGEYDKYQKKVMVAWSTASEISNDYFILKYSPDGDDFRGIERIKARGNSSIKQDYKETIAGNTSPIFGYFQLWQYDFFISIQV